MALSVLPSPHPDAVAFWLDQIAAELGQDSNLPRIKKLLFYVCTKTWETNAQRLERLSLSGLLQQLLTSSPTLEALQQNINQAAATLNKSAEYIILANALVSRFSGLYAELYQGSPTRQAAYWLVVQQFQALAPAAQLRVKKLLLLTCRGTWENAADRLEALSLPELVRELHQIAPTAESLKTTLNQVAQALSKPDAYSQVAETITLACQRLYSEASLEAVTEPRPVQLVVPPAEITQPENTEAESTQAEPGLPVSDLASLPNLTAEQPTRTMLRVVRPAVKAARPLTQPQLRLVQAQKTVDLFDLRLEVMQGSSPYRVKILLFSLLHEPFQSNAEHEAMLRTHELDDLLRILFLSYRQYAELADKLRQMAIALAKDEYMPVAEALLRAIQSGYTVECEPPAAMPGMSAASQSEANWTEITNMKATTQEMTLPD